VQPLAEALKARDVSYFLDSEASSWGKSFPTLINSWLKNSRYTLLCLSRNFLVRPWTRTELDVELARQHREGTERLLPLILDSKAEVLDALPIISNLTYREFDEGVEVIAESLSTLVKAAAPSDPLIRVVIESVHTGKRGNLKVSPRESVSSLALRAKKSSEVREEADFGTATPFKIRWVLVDAEAEDDWDDLDLEEQHKVAAVVKTKAGLKVAHVGERKRLEDIGVYDGIVFHLRGIDNNPRPKRSTRGGYGYGGGFGGGGIHYSRW
jgi:hypothetical protein